jgi:phasin family protein
MSKSTAKKTKTTTTETPKTLEASIEAGIESATAFSQNNVDAIVASSKIATKAAESLGAEIAAYSKKSYEDGMAAAKELTACKSVSDFVEKQAEFSKTSIEGFVTGATRLNEMYTAAAKEIFEPLNARITATAEMVKDYRI